MAINIQDGFYISTNKPVDDRDTFPTIAARDALSLLRRYPGLKTFVEETGLSYKLVGGIANENWTEEASGGGSGNTDIRLSDYSSGNIGGAYEEYQGGLPGYMMDASNMGVGFHLVMPSNYDPSTEVLKIRVPVIMAGLGANSVNIRSVYKGVNTTFEFTNVVISNLLQTQALNRYELLEFEVSNTIPANALVRFSIESRVGALYSAKVFFPKTGAYMFKEKRP